MPASKTFSKIRVRGQARFDNVPMHKGVPLPAYLEYAALLEWTGPTSPGVTVLINSLDVVNAWARQSAGEYALVLAGAFPAGRTIVMVQGGTQLLVARGFRSDDDTVFVTTVRPLLFVDFSGEDYGLNAESVDPEEGVVSVSIRVF